MMSGEDLRVAQEAAKADRRRKGEGEFAPPVTDREFKELSKSREQAPPKDQKSAPLRWEYEGYPLSLDDWASRVIPARDLLLGSILTTTTRAMLAAETGLGKTHLGFAFAFAMATGSSFCHWAATRPAKVLIVDGEMSRELVKERLADAERRAGKRPTNLSVLCHEDSETMAPLDTEEGQVWLDHLIEHLRGVDFLILDNVMSLTIGNLKEEEDWQYVVPWMLSLTKRRIGVLWINHTGHDKSRAYGTSTREWQLDTVMVAEKIEDSEADIAMKLTFTKARQRRPENRDDYKTVTLRLSEDVWKTDNAQPERKRKQGDYALALLTRAIEEDGEQIPGQKTGVRGVSTQMWKRYCETYDLSVSDNPTSQDRAFDRARKTLLDKQRIIAKRGKVWIIQ